MTIVNFNVMQSFGFEIWVMVFNATFNNISVITWQSVLLVEENGENHRPVASPSYVWINLALWIPREY
jgi:hypothetical protein